MNQPLVGMKVLDFSQNLPGPYATFILASLGAEVIKVEPPKGDPGRHMEPFFSYVNRGKRSIVLDLRDEAAQPSVRALVQWADVLVEGFRPGVMARLGCGPEHARAWNPALLYCAISAFGQTGPRASEPAHDLNLQALTGVCHLERDAAEVPRGGALPLADLSTSLAAVAAICAHRGQPGLLDIAMSDAALSWAWLWGEGVDLAGNASRQLSPVARRAAQRTLLAPLAREKLYAMPHYGVFRCRDGVYLAVGIVDEKHFWKALCEGLGLPWLGGLGLPSRTALGPALRAAIRLRMRQKDSETWMRRLDPVKVPVSPVLSAAQALEEPQFVGRGLVGPHGVRAPVPGAVTPARAAPGLGEHTEELLAMVAERAASVGEGSQT